MFTVNVFRVPVLCSGAPSHAAVAFFIFLKHPDSPTEFIHKHHLDHYKVATPKVK